MHTTTTRRVAAAVPLVLALAAGSASCGGNSGEEVEGGGFATTVLEPPSTTGSTGGTAVVDVDLGAVLLADVPGLSRIPDDAAPGLGPLDLDGAAKLVPDPRVRPELERLGFRRAHTRSFGKQNPTEALLLKVTELESDASAEKWAGIASTGRAERSFGVPGVDDAKGFETTIGRDQKRSVVVFAKGPRVYELYWDKRGSFAAEADVVAAAQRQFQGAP